MAQVQKFVRCRLGPSSLPRTAVRRVRSARTCRSGRSATASTSQTDRMNRGRFHTVPPVRARQGNDGQGSARSVVCTYRFTLSLALRIARSARFPPPPLLGRPESRTTRPALPPANRIATIPARRTRLQDPPRRPRGRRPKGESFAFPAEGVRCRRSPDQRDLPGHYPVPPLPHPRHPPIVALPDAAVTLEFLSSHVRRATLVAVGEALVVDALAGADRGVPR